MNPDWSLSTGRDYTETQSWIESRLWVNSLEMICVEHDIFLPLESAERQDSSLSHCLCFFIYLFNFFFFLQVSIFVRVCIVEVVVTHVTHREHSCKTLNAPQGNPSTGHPTTTKTIAHSFMLRGFSKVICYKPRLPVKSRKGIRKYCGGFMFRLHMSLIHSWEISCSNSTQKTPSRLTC